MKLTLLLFIQLFATLCFVNNVFAQKGIASINTNSTNLPQSSIIVNRKGAGVQNVSSGLEGRWDSLQTNFQIFFNAGNSDLLSISNISIAGVGTGTEVPLNVIAKVRRVANAQVLSTNDYFPYFALIDAAPSALETTGTFLINAPEVTNMETALVSNNINTGYDNIFQNNNVNVHYSNVERIDYIFPVGFQPAVGADLKKIGFTIYDAGEDGSPFNIAGIKAINSLADPLGYITPLVSVKSVDYGNKLFASASKDFVIFQKDPNFNSNESRPSVVVNQNIRGVFISLDDLGFTAGQMIYGFSIFANDISTSSSEAYLLNFNGFPTNSNSDNMLDLVNSTGVYSFGQNIVLANASYLTATLQNTKVLLQWNNATFTDAQLVYLQKATTDMVYKNIATLSYSQTNFIDESERGELAYYRLKIVNTSGVIKYSNIQTIRNKFGDTHIFPTVATNNLFISLGNVELNKPVCIEIYALDGKLVKSIQKMGNSTMNIDISSLQNATYIISLSQNNEVFKRQKFIKQ